jgi:glycosyltransferase involved in cell wall biosynthesis
MGAGRPVLYYDTPENREAAGDAGLGFRFSGGETCEEVLARVVDDDAALADLGERSRRRVEDRFRWSDIAGEYERVLEELC